MCFLFILRVFEKIIFEFIRFLFFYIENLEDLEKLNDLNNIIDLKLENEYNKY
jgi:hypothetical protein